MTDSNPENRSVQSKRLLVSLRGALLASLLVGCSAEHDAGYHATCSPMYELERGIRGAALNELFPGDGGIYCVENLGNMDCIGNYCKRDEGTTWTR